ncbi:MAG: DNA primase [Polyangiaceae bacterium]|nr:DNA primase [Polyangiaceae bacterium]MCW5790704.1 DNA primase [Polyangiaceae bacterium]
MISQETIDQVKGRMKAVAIIGEYVSLERRGRSHIGLCPFHKEKTPSFHVSDERNFYHCFGCGAKGDPIGFLIEHEGLSYPEAIRHIAEREGIVVVEGGTDSDRRQAAEQRRRVEEMYDAGALAAAYYERMLREHPLAHFARDELARRGLDPAQGGAVQEALAAFRVGYAPYSWDALGRHVKDQGANLFAAERVGLLVPRKSGPGHYDRFRHRLMFAVLDLRGRVVAFSGRALPEPSEQQLAAARATPLSSQPSEPPAKYLNSPESPVYKKREVLFGLYQARSRIRELDRCVLVEGNFDVVSLHARGLTEVVAPLGTAFTAEQGREIRRYTANAVLLFDGDDAGRRAVEASRAPCRQVGIAARVATLPDGVDPDDLARESGPEAVRRVIQAGRSMLEHLIETTLDERMSGALDQAQRVARLRQLLAEEEDPTVRAFGKRYVDTVAARLGISDPATLRSLAAGLGLAPSGAAPGPMAGLRVDVDDPRAPNTGGPAAWDVQASRLPPLPPERARSRNRQGEIALEIFGAFLDFPALLSDRAGVAASGFLEGDLALAYVALRAQALPFESERVLAALPVTIQRFAAGRLAAPKHERFDDARSELIANLKQIEQLTLTEEGARVVDELRQAAAQGDFEQELSLLSERFRRARERRR